MSKKKEKKEQKNFHKFMDSVVKGAFEEDIEIQKVSEVYKLSLLSQDTDDFEEYYPEFSIFSITVKKTEDSLTIETGDGHDKFLFDCSNPITVRAIGRLLIKASEL